MKTKYKTVYIPISIPLSSQLDNEIDRFRIIFIKLALFFLFVCFMLEE
jgi:hypothetical protein